MRHIDARSALNQYAKVKNGVGVTEATPHRLIQMLMEGALDKIAIAKFHIEQNEVGPKGESISTALSIIDGLRVSLDKSAGGEIAENLDALYEYMGFVLVEANLNNNIAQLDEVSQLLREIKSAWDAIPGDVIMDHASKAKADDDKAVSNGG